MGKYRIPSESERKGFINEKMWQELNKEWCVLRCYAVWLL
jgi:hypothetical protein